MTGLSTGLLALRLSRSVVARRSGWFVVTLLLLGALIVLHLFAPGRAGLIVGPAWLLLLVLPLLLASAMRRATLRGQFALALWIARLLAMLHPFDGMTRQPRVIAALLQLDRGQIERARQTLSGLQHHHEPLARTAQVLLARAEGQWHALLLWLDSGPRSALLADSAVFVGALRALGETGQTDRMLATWQERGGSDGAGKDATDQHLASLMVAAFSGRVALVGALLEGPLSVLNAANQNYWRGTVAQVAGDESGAQAYLQRAADDAHGLLAREVSARRQTPLAPLPEDALDAPQRAALDALTAALLHERRYAPLSGGGGRPLATWGLALLLVAVFAFEIPGGSEDLQNLVELGALVVPTSITEGEWWRRLSAGFLHFGPLHLLMNLSGLLLLGHWLERVWGRRRLAACFLFCTLASLVLYPPLASATVDDPQVVVGASGGVMGLLGALLGYLLVGRSQGQSAVVSAQLRTMLMLVGIQVLFDLSTPMVSSTAHLLGLGTGLVLGVLEGRRMVGRRAEAVAAH